MAMNPKRKQRMTLILFLLACFGVVLGLAMYALQENINLFYSPDQIVQGEAPIGQVIRAGGMVKVGTIVRSTTDLKVDFVVSDHSPCTPELKHIDSGDIEKAWGGISSLQFGLSIIWTEAQERDYSLEQVIDWMATRPARFAGLGQRKGEITPGFDADLVIFDDEADYTISADMIKYRHKITPYEGRRVKGVIRSTIVRGHTVFAEGEFAAEPVGQPLLAKHKP